MLFGKPTDDTEILDQIEAVTADRVSSVAADMIAGGDPVIASIGPEAGIMENQALADIFAAGRA